MDEDTDRSIHTRREVMCGIAGGGVAVVGSSVDADPAMKRQSSGDATVWSADSGGAIQEYVVTETSVYVGTDRGRLRRLDRTTGEVRDSVSLGAGVTPGGLAVTGEHVVAATENDEFVVYDIGALDSGASPVYRSRLADALIGMSAHDGVVCVGTRGGLIAFDLTAMEFRWRRYTDDMDIELFAPPMVYDEYGLVLTGDTTLLFVAPETGEIDLRVPFEEPNHVNVLSRPPAAITEAGRYVAYSGSDAHGCCPSWATFVVDRETREFAYRRFARSERQQSGAVTDDGMVHQLGDESVVFADFGGGGEYRTRYAPRFDGIATGSGRTFIADSSTDAATSLVAVENDGYGVAWTQSFDVPIERIRTAGESLFGIHESEGRLFAFAQSGAGADLREGAEMEAGGSTVGGTDTAGDGNAATGGGADSSTSAAPTVSGDTAASSVSVPVLGIRLSMLESVFVIVASLVTILGGLLRSVGWFSPNN